MQAGGRGPGKSLWGWTHPDFTPHHYLLPGGISTHHGRCGIQEAHDLHLNVILAKALQHLHNLTQRQPLTIHVLNGNNIIPFLGSCRLKKNMISIQVNVLFSEIPEVVPKFINKIVICISWLQEGKICGGCGGYRWGGGPRQMDTWIQIADAFCCTAGTNTTL